MTEQTAKPGLRAPIALSQQGSALPLGISHGGQLHRDLVARPWRLAEERELGALHASAKDANMAEYVSMVVATMCSRLGPHDFTTMDANARRVAVNQMFMGDVFFAYVYLRIQSIGPDLTLQIKVPGRQGDVKYVADLNTVDVVCADSFEAATYWHNLSTPLMIRGQQVNRLKLGPLRWSSLEGDRRLGDGNKGVAKAMAIRGAICGSDAFPELQVTDAELDELTKRDIEAMANAIDKNAIGPVMVIEDQYEGKPFKVGIDWRYDNFFAVSSD